MISHEKSFNKKKEQLNSEESKEKSNDDILGHKMHFHT
jgi:hypothetical protein